MSYPEVEAQLAAGLERRFSDGGLQTIGLEEELILLDPDSLRPLNGIEAVLAMVDDERRFKPEFRAAQIELVTPVCLTPADAGRELVSARRDLVRELRGRVRVLAAGTHPSSIETVVVGGSARHRRIASEYPWAGRRGWPSALHVHVGIGDPDDALAVYNAARSYLPELAALAANSPYFEGRDSGLASSRLKLTEDFPRSGVPPVFETWREFAAFVSWGRASGSFADVSFLWWDLRLRPEYGTLEFRIADTQTTGEEAAAFAAVCHALVASLRARAQAGDPLPVHASHRINENRWRAIRDGLDGQLADLETGLVETTGERLERLLCELEPAAAETGCASELAAALSLLRGNGAMKQRASVAEHGIEGLVERLADQTENNRPNADAGDGTAALALAPIV